MPINYID